MIKLTILSMSEADGLTLDLSWLWRLTISFLCLMLCLGYNFTVGILLLWWNFGTKIIVINH